MNHQKLLCLCALFTESPGQSGHHWALRKMGKTPPGTPPTHTTEPPATAPGPVLPELIHTARDAHRASSSNNTEFKTVLLFLCLFEEIRSGDNFPFMCWISGTQHKLCSPGLLPTSGDKGGWWGLLVRAAGSQLIKLPDAGRHVWGSSQKAQLSVSSTVPILNVLRQMTQHIWLSENPRRLLRSNWHHHGDIFTNETP